MRCLHFGNQLCDVIGRDPADVGITCSPNTCNRFCSASEGADSSHTPQQTEKEESDMGGKWKPEYGRTRRTKTHTSTAVKNRYNSKHYDRIGFVVPAGSGERIKARAASLGLSVNEYMRHLIIADAPECIVYVQSDNTGGGQ